jgi:hypothetical protein
MSNPSVGVSARCGCGERTAATFYVAMLREQFDPIGFIAERFRCHACKAPLAFDRAEVAARLAPYKRGEAGGLASQIARMAVGIRFTSLELEKPHA